MKEYPFVNPDEEHGYRIFPSELEDDSNILFHGTPRKNYQSIVDVGFKNAKTLKKQVAPGRNRLSSISFAKNSNDCLIHLWNMKQNKDADEFVVFAVKFDTLESTLIRAENSNIYVLDEKIQPQIIGYTFIPANWIFD